MARKKPHKKKPAKKPIRKPSRRRPKPKPKKPKPQNRDIAMLGGEGGDSDPPAELA
jgi:hypothetical protein